MAGTAVCKTDRKSQVRRLVQNQAKKLTDPFSLAHVEKLNCQRQHHLHFVILDAGAPKRLLKSNGLYCLVRVVPEQWFGKCTLLHFAMQGLNWLG